MQNITQQTGTRFLAPEILARISSLELIARAVMSGRYNVSAEDARALAYPILRHRILLNFHAESERVKPDDVIRRLIESVPEPKSGL